MVSTVSCAPPSKRHYLHLFALILFTLTFPTARRSASYGESYGIILLRAVPA